MKSCLGDWESGVKIPPLRSLPDVLGRQLFRGELGKAYRAVLALMPTTRLSSLPRFMLSPAGRQCLRLTIRPLLSRPLSGGSRAELCFPRSDRMSPLTKGLVGQQRPEATACFQVQQWSERSRQFPQSHQGLARPALQACLLWHRVLFEAGLSLDGEWRTRRLAIYRRQGSGRNDWTALCRHRMLQVLSADHRQEWVCWDPNRGSLNCPLVWRFDPVRSGRRRCRSWGRFLPS